jgi:hypothetical protein
MNNNAQSAGLSGSVSRSNRKPGVRVLADRRSDRYLRALGAFDGSGQVSAADVEELAEAAHREFADKFCSTPLGIIGKCYLGAPYEVHTLAMDRSIIEHYRSGEALPHGMDKARALAESDRYLAVEVYTDRLVCVLPDGSVVLLESDS